MMTKETGDKAIPLQREHNGGVRIHIDQNPYDSPDPTTGEALYALGQVAEGFILFREIRGEEDDTEVPKTSEVIDLRPGEHFYTRPREKKEITVIVNAQERTVTEKHLSFVEVVALAFDPVPSGPNILFTVSYWNGPRPNPEGTMLNFVSNSL